MEEEGEREGGRMKVGEEGGEGKSGVEGRGE